ncbi:MAG: hypothetical protein VCC00_15015 [Deltaproteobacteria bacterium]
MKKSQMLTIVSLLVLAGILTLLSLEISQVKCEVCMDFKGRLNCATAAAPSRSEAVQSGRMTACGPISAGVRDSFGCNAAQPASVTCS